MNINSKKVDVVRGSGAPIDRHALWFDDAEKQLKYNDGDGWESSQSNGDSLPTITNEDEGKVMLVTPVLKETKTEETVIVPEQTCNMEDEGKRSICTLQNVDESFGPGFSGIVILDGMEYDVEWPEEWIIGFPITENVHIETGSDNFELIDANKGSTHTIKVITRETEPVYDYNWVPGVKIPVPTAEDEGKILVVTKVEGSNTSIIVPEQSVPVAENIPLTDVDLTKFIVGNTVKVTINYVENTEALPSEHDSLPELAVSDNPTLCTATGVIEEDDGEVFVFFENDGNDFAVLQTGNSLYTSACDRFDPNSTIKLEYVESSYEYQLHSPSNVLWPAMYEYDGSEIMATFVPEDVKSNTWCMVYGIDNNDNPICLPVKVIEFGNYAICNKTDNHIVIDEHALDGGNILQLLYNENSI